MSRYLPGPTGNLPTRVTVTTGAVPAAGTVDVTVTWPSAYPSGGLTVVASVVSDHAGEGLMVRRIRTVTATDCVVHVANTGLVSRTGTVHVLVSPT